MNNKIKLIEGIIVNNTFALNGTLFVKVSTSKYDTFYRRIIKKYKIYPVHYADKKNITLGTKVLIKSCRPISKTKSHEIEEIRNV